MLLVLPQRVLRGLTVAIVLHRYVAMHAMQEDDASHQETYSNGYAAEGHAGHAPPKQGPTMSLTLAAVAGMLLPLLTQFGHHH